MVMAHCDCVTVTATLRSRPRRGSGPGDSVSTHGQGPIEGIEARSESVRVTRQSGGDPLCDAVPGGIRPERTHNVRSHGRNV